MRTTDFMRILLFFDLPVKREQECKEATKFRNFLLKDGFFMVQYSVYVRVCNNLENCIMHENRIKQNLPQNGSVRLLIITEKQYESMRIFIGKKKAEEQAPKGIEFY